jgi:hypothetical protein
MNKSLKTFHRLFFIPSDREEIDSDQALCFHPVVTMEMGINRRCTSSQHVKGMATKIMQLREMNTKVASRQHSRPSQDSHVDRYRRNAMPESYDTMNDR